MKLFAGIVKYVIIPCSSLIGVIYAFDMYLVNRAKTVMEPTKVRVDAMIKNVEEVTIRTRNIEKILMQERR